MMNRPPYILFGCMLVLLVGCSKTELDARNYIHWMENSDNLMNRTFEQGDLKLTCQYMTPEYSVIKQHGPNNLSSMELQDNIDGISDMIEFRLRFEREGERNFMHGLYTTEEEFNTRSMYLSYDIQYDLKLVAGGDTIPCGLNHHERTYGNTPFETLMIAFPSNHLLSERQDMELILNDRVFGYGRVKFYYTKEELEAIPELKL